MSMLLPQQPFGYGPPQQRPFGEGVPPVGNASQHTHPSMPQQISVPMPMQAPMLRSYGGYDGQNRASMEATSKLLARLDKIDQSDGGNGDLAAKRRRNE